MDELRTAVGILTGEMRGILREKLHSVWLYGSVVMDDFRPGWSDIDFIALTGSPPTAAEAEQLLPLRQALSARYPGRPFFRCFEGITASLEEYRTGSFTRLVYWGTTGQRITDRHTDDPFARFELARAGERVHGDGDRRIFAEPGTAELTAAVRRHYETIRTYAVQTDGTLYACGWLLDMARCIYTLRHHGVIAKTRAGEWALEEHVFPDEEALRRTLEIRRDPPRFRDLPETKRWLADLGPTVQRCADVLEDELARSDRPGKQKGLQKAST